MLPLTNIGTIALTLCRRPRRLFIGHRYSRFRRQDHSGRPQDLHCTISHRRSRPSGLRSGAPKGDRASPPCCSRAGVRAASRGPISNPTNTSKVEYAGSERPGIRLSDPVAFVGVFTRRDEFFLGPLTLASLRGEFSYWCT